MGKGCPWYSTSAQPESQLIVANLEAFDLLSSLNLGASTARDRNNLTEIVAKPFGETISQHCRGTPHVTRQFCTRQVVGCEPPTLLQESFGPFGPKVSRQCPRECPRKRGVSAGVSDGVSPGPFGSLGCGVSKKCPESVPEVSGTPF